MATKTTGLFDDARLARRRLRKSGAAVVAVLVALRILAEIAPVMRRPDLALLDFWQSLRATDEPTPQVVIVAVDEKSIANFGPMLWPRNQYVPLIERLSAAGARVVAFDFTFGALAREAGNNLVLAEAFKKAGNVVFGYEFTKVGDPSPPTTPPTAGLQAHGLSAYESLALPSAPDLIHPEPALLEAAAAIGHVTTVEGDDGRIRTVPLFVRHGEKAYPSLALQIARVYTKTALEDVVFASGRVRMGSCDIPVSASGEILLDWPAAGERAFPQYSFYDVRGDVPAGVFRDKVVLVAGTASGTDDRDFPFAVEAPGVLMYATFLDNVFRVHFVQAPAWAFLAEWGLFLAACALGVWLMPRLSTAVLLAGVPALAVAILGAAAFCLVQQGLWIKSIFPALALLAPLASTIVLRLAASEKATADETAEKIESQKLLALSFQEKGMLDMALAAFGKLPFTEDMKQVYLNLALDYQNRGQRDKALVVYQKIFSVDPAFGDVAARIERLKSATTGSHLAMPRVASPAQSTEATADLSAASVSLEATHASMATPPPTALSVQYTSVGSSAPVAAAAPDGPILPGTRFARYEVERHLGRGGMGDVYLVRDTVIDRRAALKTIRADAGMDARHVIEIRQRFYREAQTAGKLAHPNIVTVYDVGEEQGMSYIVMEFVEGSTLTQLMKKQRLTLPQINHILYHAAVGLDFAHRHGVFHRDVKPDNVMITKTEIVKVMDFGIARIADSDLTRTGSIMGTPSYMSPEQFIGKKIDARSDIFSLGVILYELLTGSKPFNGETVHSLMFSIMQTEPPHPSTVDTKLHPAWDDILKKALAKEPEGRYATAMDLAEAVKNAPGR
jgi:serine/threonine-protein kinase